MKVSDTSITKDREQSNKQIACFLGNKHLARVVGNILHKNPDSKSIPCHRVVNSTGELSKAYAVGGVEAQRNKLEKEGIIFNQNGTIDLLKYRFEE